ncbi:TerC family protein [Neisseria weaveri]|uniref:Membrane protein, TerC family/CBS domain/transporter associated domain protein n=1 Tax=Neisseria weaveri TaxID=28091 RepID=A0A3S5CA31_9NEIS|nr:TerC family protein [Neisseria weaveri]EGV36770.1 membrane protein, TerC family/CBS domain/transporter associated domain protein [Neisseria weaveri ATCC 51223]EGV38661.1 membrane protein, TerC family/CBS domain/transporter associated domain protein [Neisseria weaveri LMG 5135]SAY51527.1 membrane protein, TerC family/CBS domain/transporter associated domain protein [Neisseria weaveri]VEJ50653.1 membrane protein, TerC family/CBS domain/transporter associated domain protein [Neisseria weaveri]
MDFSWLAEPHTWIGFATLLILEVVLGIDNLVFVAILANKVKPSLRDKARITGLGLAVVMRIIMLGFMAHIITLTQPFFHIAGWAVSGKDLIMLFGGLFLLYKATTELHERLEGHNHFAVADTHKTHAPFWGVVLQILVLDAVFSIDSVITAVAMVDHIVVAMAAVVVAMTVMILASKPLTEFVDKHPTVVMLCLGFLLMIGFSLIAEAFHFHIPKGYLYAAIGFSILIEMFNQISQKNTRKNDYISSSWRQRTAENVLGMMGIRESVLAASGDKASDDTHFEENEKSMIRSVLTLAERPILGVMIPRRDIERLDISQSKEEQHIKLQETPYSRLLVVGKAGVDEPLGYINKKDLLNQVLENGEINIQTALRQPLVLPETTTALNAIELFRNNSADYALVVDEFGAVLGMVTMKDLLETIAGEFPEEFEREEEPTLQANADHSLTVDGALEYVELAPQLGLPPQDEDADYHTVAGLIMEELQSLPDVGDFAEFHGWRFEVIEKAGQRIERVKITKVPEEE